MEELQHNTSNFTDDQLVAILEKRGVSVPENSTRQQLLDMIDDAYIKIRHS